MLTRLVRTLTRLDHTLTRLDHTLTRLDHAMTRLDRALTRLDHTMTRLDHAMTRLDHTLTRLDRALTRLVGTPTRMRTLARERKARDAAYANAMREGSVRRTTLVLLLGLLGCRGQSSSAGDMWFAGIATGLAAVTSLPNLVRDSRNCPESCPPEYGCNHLTGYCDRLPCGGHCTGSQSCSVSGALEVCSESAAPASLFLDPSKSALDPLQLLPQRTLPIAPFRSRF